MTEIKVSRRAVAEQKYAITCKTDTLSDVVSFQHPPGTLVASCLPGQLCIHGKYSLTQQLADIKTILTISSYTKSRDDGDWLCYYLGKASNLLTLNASSKCSVKIKFIWSDSKDIFEIILNHHLQ